MELLRLLTLIWAGILVVAVAVVLVSILYHLWRIGSELQRVRGSLGDAERPTRSLEEVMAPLRQDLEETARSLESAAELLDKTTAAVDPQREEGEIRAGRMG